MFMDQLYTQGNKLNFSSIKEYTHSKLASYKRKLIINLFSALELQYFFKYPWLKLVKDIGYRNINTLLKFLTYRYS